MLRIIFTLISSEAHIKLLCPSNCFEQQYAWFNGIDPKAMRETDGVVEGAESCVEGENYRGKPEWECD